jgi:hypothetical protein
MTKNGKRVLIGCGSPLLLFAVIGIVLSVTETGMENKIKPLIDRVEEYGAMTGESAAQAAASPMKAFIVQNREKVGDHGEKYEYSPLYFRIPESLRAKTPEEMNTLVQLDRHTDAAGKYTTGKTAYDRCIDVTVIDIASGKVIRTESFVGRAPTVLIGSQKPYGEWPDSLVVDLIEEMAGGYVETPSQTFEY